MVHPDLLGLRVVDLKELCKTHDLDTKGKKADLQERLTVFLNSQDASKSTDATAEPETSQTLDVKAEAPSSQEKAPEPEEESAPAEEAAPLQDFKAEKPSSQELPTESVSEPADPEPAADQSLPDFKTEKPSSQERPVEDEPDPEPEDQEEISEKAQGTAPVQPVLDIKPDVSQLRADSESPQQERRMSEEDMAEVVSNMKAEALQEAATEERESMETETPVCGEEATPDKVMEVDSDKSRIVEEERAAKKERRKKSRWTQEAPEVKIGVQLSGPAPEKPRVALTDESGNRLTKAQRKKLKKKRRKAEKRSEMDSGHETGNDSGNDKKDASKKTDKGFEIDYIAEEPDLDPSSLQFKRVFEAFRAAEMVMPEMPKKSGYQAIDQEGDNMMEDSDDDDKKDDGKDKLSKKKLKKQSRLTVAELKQIVERPDLVEMHDVTSMDPKLLVLLKSGRNSVPVPRHWSYKRKYLSGKRGIEKPPFELPEFIKKTGIMEMREALQQKDAEQSMKTKMRQRVRPKLGKIDIDYQKLHDAFFRYQTKPKMTRHGDIYYEGKEYETRLRELKPGELTDDLRTALGMPLGNNAHKVPPPWLIAMQRYGPPPSYPNLKIPGLNAPIPSGCSFGYHAGGWGKPPVDERGRPLYGDVFGVDVDDTRFETEKPSEALWGEMESESDDSSTDGSEDESEDEGDQDGTGVPTQASNSTSQINDGLMTPSGITSEAPPAETDIELRKPQKAVDMSNPPPLYQVLEEKKASVGKGMMGTGHVYDLKAAKGQQVSINPEDLELDPAALASKYQGRSATSGASGSGGTGGEDMSDMMAEHLNKTARDRKRKQTGGKESTDPKSKKYKDFKF